MLSSCGAFDFIPPMDLRDPLDLWVLLEPLSFYILMLQLMNQQSHKGATVRAFVLDY